ncbi:hypothetical protein V8G54_006511 [Vigna mungo]|uniref:Uncharacterized protein n=1 Tax=Vigna mungo TaxID=3915 RepID=A0AAQ3S853_VIGMU
MSKQTLPLCTTNQTDQRPCAVVATLLHHQFVIVTPLLCLHKVYASARKRIIFFLPTLSLFASKEKGKKLQAYGILRLTGIKKKIWERVFPYTIPGTKLRYLHFLTLPFPKSDSIQIFKTKCYIIQT